MRGWLDVEMGESNQSTYNKYIGLTLDVGSGEPDKILRFNTGDPVVDWYDYMVFIYNGEATQTGINSVSHSSSVGHFIMDSSYKEVYAKYDDQKEEYEFATDEELDMTPLSEWNRKFFRFVINDSIHSFKELKEWYKNYKSRYPNEGFQHKEALHGSTNS